VIGLGPAGLGASLKLAGSSIAGRVICIEAGTEANLKFCSILEGKGCRFVKPCQIITGVGGSSLLSGGKVSLFPAGRSMTSILGSEDITKDRLSGSFRLFRQYVPLLAPDISVEQVKACELFFGGKGFNFRYYDSFRYRQADLVSGYERMLNDIASSGMSIRLNTRVVRIERLNEGFQVVATNDTQQIKFVTKRVILAVGRFGKSLLRDIDSDMHLESQPNTCDIGVRLEFPTSVWPDIDSCHKDLKLHFLNARTFCVCKDGLLAPYRVDNVFLLEGHADPDMRTGFTNLALTVRSGRISGEVVLADLERRLLPISKGKPIRQSLRSFLAQGGPDPENESHPSSISYWQSGNIKDCLPEDVYSEVHQAVEFFATQLLPQESYSKVFVFAPEIDYYWPRFPLRPGFLSRKAGIYIIGDSAGHFRGILQAFCSGLECAEHILGS
jgi:uncharacterized protein